MTIAAPSRAALPLLPPYAAAPEPLRNIARNSADAIHALYLHVPFCAAKCHYCDFYSIAGHLDQTAAYLAALERELALQTQYFGPPRPRTIFIGGGTPTLLDPAPLAKLLDHLQSAIDASVLEEFTVEANPNTFTAEKATVLARAGVNRVSFGAQSFHATELATLQRDHDPASVAPAFAHARAAGINNLSVDLIFGIPGQTLASWDASLTRALALEPAHMSCYSLTYEPNTAMTARLRAGEFAPLDEEIELAMFNHVHARMRDAGFERYEISNYARRTSDGPRVCRHNLAYWQAGNWLAFGPSAGAHVAIPPHARTPGQPAAYQWKNAGSLAHYLAALSVETPRLPLTQMETLGPREWAAGAAVFWLRLSEGLEYRAFLRRTAVDARGVLGKALLPFAELGLVELTAERARLLENGVAVSNRVLAAALEAMEAG